MTLLSNTEEEFETGWIIKAVSHEIRRNIISLLEKFISDPDLAKLEDNLKIFNVLPASVAASAKSVPVALAKL